MIYTLTGILADKEPDFAVIDCCGVGFAVSISANTASQLPEIGQEVFLFTQLSVKENGIELYGFGSVAERETFRLLCGVSGVGAKLALSVLSTYDPDRFALLIMSGDHKSLTACPGVGPRLAQRMVLELKDKLGKMGGVLPVSPGKVAVPQGSAASEAMAALTALGFSASEAAQAIASLPPEYDTQQMVSAALRNLAAR